MSVQLEKTVDRRRVVKGAAWSVPAVIAAGSVPAQAVSPGKNANATTGLFVTVARTNGPTGTQHMADIDQVFWNGPGSEPDFRWDDAQGCSNAVLTTNGEGLFTPRGTIGSDGQIGGTGFWLSSPRTADGQWTSGTASLLAGAQFAVDYVILRVRSDQWTSVTKGRGSGFINGTGRLEKGVSNGYRSHISQVETVRTTSNESYKPVTINGRKFYEWSGTLNFKTKADLIASGPTEKYAQLSLAKGPVTGNSGEVFGFRATVRPVSGTIVTNSNGKRTTTQLTDAVQPQTAFWVPCDLKGAV